jgi:Ca-activated chloride channel homolog
MKHRMIAIALAASAVAATATAPVTIRVTSPLSGAYVTGAVMLRVEIRPPGRAVDVAHVTFFVDGREVCAATAAPFECECDVGREVSSHVVRAVAVLNDGRRLTDSVRTEGLGYADKVSVDAVQITVVVTDEAQRFVPRLSRDAFRVFEDDKPQSLSVFEADEVPLDLIAALDVSHSMTDAMPDLKQTARAFLTAMRENERVTLLAFNDNIFTLARRTTATEAKLRAVDRLAPWGGTALYDVIVRSMSLLQRQGGRRAVVVFSDGDDQSSRATLDAAIRSVEASDATVYTVGLGRATRARELHDLLEKIAAVSGGRALFADKGDGLGTAFSAIIDDLSHQYLIGYQPVNQRRDGAWRKIRVEVKGPYRLRHRQGYRLLPEGRS